MNQTSLFDPEPGPTPNAESDGDPDRSGAPTRSEPSGPRRTLVIEADGGSRGNPGPAGYGALVREGGTVLAERAEFLGVASNNVAEYSGLISGLTAARQVDPTALVEVRMDSKLVVEQMSGRWKIKHEDMRRLARQARDAFVPAQVSYTWVPRAQNKDADALANQVMDSTGQIRNNYPVGDDAHHAGRPEPGAASGVTPGSSPGTDDGAPRPSDVGVPIPDIDADSPSISHTDVLTLVLVSPGRTEHPATDVPGHPDSDPELTQEGIDLAAGAAGIVDVIGDELWPHLPSPSVLLSTPLVRAQQTAQLISEITGLGAPTVDRDFTRAAADEPLSHVAHRVTRALNRLMTKYPGRTVVVAAHADVIAAVVGLVSGLPTESWDLLRIAPGTVSIVRRWSDSGEVHVVGCPAQLGDGTG